MKSLRTRAISALPGVFLTLSLPGLLAGQSIPSPYRFIDTRQEAGIFASQLSPGTGNFDFGPGAGFAAGARYGVRLGGAFGAEGSVTYLPTQRSLIDPGREEGDRKIGEVDSEILILETRLRFSLTGDRTWRGLAPFLFAGGGVAFDLAPEDPAEEALLPEDRFNFGTPLLGVLGGGLRWLPGERFTLRGDVGILIWQIRAPKGYRDQTRGLEGVENRQWVSGPTLSLGVGYRF